LSLPFKLIGWIWRKLTKKVEKEYKQLKFSAKEIDNKIIIKIKGENTYKKTIGIAISLFDITNKNRKIIYTTSELHQEDVTRAFNHIERISINNKVYHDWYTICEIDTAFLQSSKGNSKRKIQTIMRIFDWKNQPNIHEGKTNSSTESKKILRTIRKSIKNVLITSPGYNEENEDSNLDAKKLAIEIGMTVAMADGTFAESEKDILQKWMKKQINHYKGEERIELKDNLELAFKDAYYESKESLKDITVLARKLKKLNKRSVEKEVFQLTQSIMRADGIIDENETMQLNKLSKTWNIKSTEVKEISRESRDELLISLGIPANLPEYQIKKKLSDSFQKWNNRLNVASSASQRDEIQETINNIARAKNECN